LYFTEIRTTGLLHTAFWLFRYFGHEKLRIQNIPPRFQEIIEDFQWSEGRGKLELLPLFAEDLPPLPIWLQGQSNLMDQVEECITPVFVHALKEDGKMVFYFDVLKSSPTYGAMHRSYFKD